MAGNHGIAKGLLVGGLGLLFFNAAKKRRKAEDSAPDISGLPSPPYVPVGSDDPSTVSFTHIKSVEEFKEAANDKAAFFYFYMKGCGACDQIWPIIREWSVEDHPNISFYMVNGESEGAASIMEIVNIKRQYPTFVAYSKGQQVGNQVGYDVSEPEEDLLEFIEDNVGQKALGDGGVEDEN